MKIITEELTYSGFINNNNCDMLRIYVNGENIFSVQDGEMKNNYLNKNFNDCWKITDLMQLAYEAGIRHEEFEIKDLQLDIP